jgi:LmbE family N-acetylglucosaminyl deacetylase
MIRYVLLIVVAVSSVVVAPRVHAEQLDALEPILSKNTRLMVFSPHPDDENLGTGGLIQRVLSLGGKVKVVFMTSGDGFPEGVELEDHISHPTANDYRKYGKEREGEALKALSVLGLKKRDVTFLGFPDGGLTYLLSKFRSDPQTYTSPFTLENHPPASDMIIPNTDYNDSDLRKEIVRLLADFRPDLLATTPAEDQHPDHYATYHFVREGLMDLGKKDSTIKPRLLTFLIHFNQWPVQGSGTGSRLDPPEDFPDKAHAKETRWISFPLSPREVETKREAILQYHTQMLVMGRSLLGFARANELFIMEDHRPAK